jgi:DNA polymerase phi
MFPERTMGKKSQKSASDHTDPDLEPPIDVLVDMIIGCLEKSSAYLRAIGNQAFSLLTGSVRESTIELILKVCSFPFKYITTSYLSFPGTGTARARGTCP